MKVDGKVDRRDEGKERERKEDQGRKQGKEEKGNGRKREVRR